MKETASNTLMQKIEVWLENFKTDPNDQNAHPEKLNFDELHGCLTEIKNLCDEKEYLWQEVQFIKEWLINQIQSRRRASGLLTGPDGTVAESEIDQTAHLTRLIYLLEEESRRLRNLSQSQMRPSASLHQIEKIKAFRA